MASAPHRCHLVAETGNTEPELLPKRSRETAKSGGEVTGQGFLQHRGFGVGGGEDAGGGITLGQLLHYASIPGWGRSPGEGNGNLLQYLCLENPTDRRA